MPRTRQLTETSSQDVSFSSGDECMRTPRAISTCDLRPGDLIVFENNYYKNLDDSGAGYDEPYTDHIAMVASISSSGVQLVHSISSGKGHYHPLKQTGLCRTTLRPLLAQIQREEGYPDRKYDVSFHVYRNCDEAVAEQALNVLLRQEQARLPYDEARLQGKLDFEESGWDDEAFMRHGMAQYEKEGRFRAVKFAARYPYPWTRTRQDGVGRGVTCSMVTILAFQVAELLIHNKVRPLERGWVSDKYGALSGQRSYSPQFLSYRRKLTKDVEEFESDVCVSADSWIGNEPIDAFVHQSFPLDAKCTGAGGIVAYMKNNPTQWLSLGAYVPPQSVFTSPEKREEYRRREESYVTGLGTVKECADLNGSFVSGRRSTERSPACSVVATPSKERAQNGSTSSPTKLAASIGSFGSLWAAVELASLTNGSESHQSPSPL